MKIRITVEETYDVPDGTRIEDVTGQRGLRLPGGEFIVPWVALEMYEDADGSEPFRDLTLEDQVRLGLDGHEHWVRLKDISSWGKMEVTHEQATC